MGDKVMDGIEVGGISVNTSYSPTGAVLYIGVSINIGEDFTTARADADTMSDAITQMIYDYVKEYADDGQEVD